MSTNVNNNEVSSDNQVLSVASPPHVPSATGSVPADAAVAAVVPAAAVPGAAAAAVVPGAGAAAAVVPVVSGAGANKVIPVISSLDKIHTPPPQPQLQLQPQPQPQLQPQKPQQQPQQPQQPQKKFMTDIENLKLHVGIHEERIQKLVDDISDHKIEFENNNNEVQLYIDSIVTKYMKSLEISSNFDRQLTELNNKLSELCSKSDNSNNDITTNIKDLRSDIDELEIIIRSKEKTIINLQNDLTSLANETKQRFAQCQCKEKKNRKYLQQLAVLTAFDMSNIKDNTNSKN